jgi:hypothetical protein
MWHPRNRPAIALLRRLAAALDSNVRLTAGLCLASRHGSRAVMAYRRSQLPGKRPTAVENVRRAYLR